VIAQAGGAPFLRLIAHRQVTDRSRSRPAARAHAFTHYAIKSNIMFNAEAGTPDAASMYHRRLERERIKRTAT